MSQYPEAFTNYKKASEDLADLLQAILNTVTKGRIISKEFVDKFNLSVADLHSFYDSLVLVAENIDPSISLGPESSLQDIQLQFDKYQKKAHQQQLDKLKYSAEQFLKVGSDNTSYMDALEPFHHEAETMLQDLTALVDGPIPELFLNTSHMYSLFLALLEKTVFTDKEGEELLDQANKIMPAKICQGLILHQYYMDPARNTQQLELKKVAATDTKTADPSFQISRAIISLFQRFGSMLDIQSMALARYFDLLEPGQYQLFSNALDSLVHKRKITVSAWDQDINIYHLPDFVEDSSDFDNAATLLRRIELNAALIEYLTWLKSKKDKPLYLKIAESIVWEDTSYEVLVPWEDMTIKCNLVSSISKEPDKENKLLVLANQDSPPKPTGVSGFVFILQKDTLYKWKNGWILSTNRSQNDVLIEPAHITKKLPADEVKNKTVSIKEPDRQKKGLAKASLATIESFGLKQDAKARDIAGQILEKGISPEQDVVFMTLLEKLIAEDRVVKKDDLFENSHVDALVLAKALAATGTDSYLSTYGRLLYGLDLPLDSHPYSGEHIINIFDDYQSNNFNQPVLLLLTMLRALFMPENPYDHTLDSIAVAYFNDFSNKFPGLSDLKPLYNLFLSVSNYSASGFSIQVLRHFTDKQVEVDLLKKIRGNALALTKEPVIKNKLKAMTQMINICFGNDSELRLAMEIIAEDRREERSFVESLCNEFGQAGPDQYSILDSKLAAYFESQWKMAISIQRGPRDLGHAQKSKIIDNIRARLELAQRWLQLTEINKGDAVTSNLMSLRQKILAEMKKVMELADPSWSPFEKAIIKAGLRRFQAWLSGHIEETDDNFIHLMNNGVFCLSENFVPDFDDAFSFKLHEPWHLALRHIGAAPVGLRTVLTGISDPLQPYLFDNLGHAISIGSFLNSKYAEKHPIDQYRADAENGMRSALEAVNKFKGELELAFAYGRINESCREEILSALEPAFERYAEYNNFGCLRFFLDALRKNVVSAADLRFEELHLDIENRRKNNTSKKLAAVLKAAEDKLKGEEANFVVAEEYINRFDAGISTEMNIAGKGQDNAFISFINNSFSRLYSLCQKNPSNSLKNFGVTFVENNLKKRRVSVQYQDSSRALLRSMPNRPGEANPSNIKTILSELGFDVTGAEAVRSSGSGNIMVRFIANIRPDAKDKAEYSHPVDIMGTQLKSPVDIICLFGRMQANDIADKVCSLELSRTAIVLLNGALDLPGRRQIAERFHRDKSGQNPFLLVDWVLLLHLATFQKTERLPILLNCTLPYTSSFQPFVLRGSVSDEMFIGRKKELNQILDPAGPVIVYGGRQLGKTALLERAKSRADHRERKEFAVLVSAADYSTEKELFAEVSRRLTEAGLQTPQVRTAKELANNLRKSYSSKQWVKLLFLIDESDRLLASFKDMTPAYQPVSQLVNLARETNMNFKFVFAGLHNVCRAASDPNSVFGQLGSPLCIKPLSAADALALLSRPLSYLGFDIENAHLEHILVNTSFYPGIVHYVGYSIVENLSNRYADYYNAASGNPPYDLTDKQLGEIMSSDALNEKINERIRWTLEVDQRYLMLARCIAYLYYEFPENNRYGHHINSIIEYAQLLEISRLESLDRQEFNTLLIELVEMGILVQPTQGFYRLRQRRFLAAIGSSLEKIEQEIKLSEEDEGHA